MRLQEASVSPLQRACSKLRFYFHSRLSGSSGLTFYSALPGSFGFTLYSARLESSGFTSTVGLREAAVLPFRVCFQEAIGQEASASPLKCASRNFGFSSTVCLPEDSVVLCTVRFQELRLHLHSGHSGNVRFTSTVGFQEASVSPFTVHIQEASVSPLQ